MIRVGDQGTSLGLAMRGLSGSGEVKIEGAQPKSHITLICT